jgi:hypothetical protein
MQKKRNRPTGRFRVQKCNLNRQMQLERNYFSIVKQEKSLIHYCNCIK